MFSFQNIEKLIIDLFFKFALKYVIFEAQIKFVEYSVINLELVKTSKVS